jgi:hypothetical protein
MIESYRTRVKEKGRSEWLRATVQLELYRGKKRWIAFVLAKGGHFKAYGENPWDAMKALADKVPLSFVDKLEPYTGRNV